ncbi:sulfite exporter TauE/SafE family protein [Flavobacterium franklandianum]|uniref:Probable membrane transporter protein n=1 Tax=Flavobacterium franklandianum TaxID=2594430 RepID=A0A553C847_9FLAO|nr:sulfite exporter TauE/SafE family protein [Flavobacterium franklandianum]TRX16681.1 sulfite exporter TauE/SafE family protein [Flavobacterium franklandianum]TRX24199.1 sulfite exporter TauE/SafE family protein [Flavobacterium franklandianum]
MEISQLIGYILAVFVGMTLGMLGSGGSILSVPILVYVMGIEPTLATAYSLFVIGTTSLVGGIHKAKQKLVDFNKVVLFGIPAVISVFITRKIIVPRIPDIIFSIEYFTLTKSVLIMIVFAIVMIFASVRMIKPLKEKNCTDAEKLNYNKIALLGICIGLLSGFVGAGGGFLIVPTLLIFAKTPMKMAVGTSLFIVSSQSLIGFIGDIMSDQIIDWKLLEYFTLASIIGIFIGNFISKKVADEKLKISFGWFVLSMGIYIIIRELFLS